MNPRPAYVAVFGSSLAALSLAGALAAEKAPSGAQASSAAPPPSAAGKVDFNRDIRPILAARCFGCHGERSRQAGLRLDRKEDALRGGDSGPAFKPGHAAESLLVRYVTGVDPKKVMPPSGDRLTARQVSLLREWIDGGAVWPDQSAGKAPAAASGHWAFQPVRRPPVPAVREPKTTVRNPIDAFVLARLRKERIAPSPEADRPTLIRRLFLDLTGLPPTPAEVDAFVSDRAPDAYEKLVDRLLASPHFGERWGRHWLDLARYADSDGYEKDTPRPYAYVYRDWVINALNRDMPFDQFTVEQLAGDLLPDATLEQKIATGFHRQTLTNKEGGVDQEEFRVKAVVDRVNTTGSVWLGLTVGCAECHTHKYDPITQREYYGLFAFFNTAQEVDLPVATPEEQAAYQKAKQAYDRAHAERVAALAAYEREKADPAVPEWEKTVDPADPKLPAAVRQVLAVPAVDRTRAQKLELARYHRTLDPEWQKLSQAVTTHAKKAPVLRGARAMTLTEPAQGRKTYIHVRGDFLRKGDEVQPATLAVLQPLPAARPTRLDLARWLVSPENPLTARVTVNRVWQHLFGRGLVRTSEDFGVRGEPPSHPQLLDWLAGWFTESGAASPNAQRPTPNALPHTAPPGAGWSLKQLIRLIVTSATYRQSSRARPELEGRDPKNVLLARQNRFRVEAEIVRDLYLAAGGLLNPAVGGPSIKPPLPPDVAALSYASGLKWQETTGPERYKRGMYVHFQRTVPFPSLTTFDAPDGNVSCTRRERSNTPLQALTLLNDPLYVEAAQALARRVLSDAPSGTAERIRHAFRLCLGRAPSARELSRLLKLYQDAVALSRASPDSSKLPGGPAPEGVAPAEAAACVVVARTIMNLDEFVTRE